MKELDSIKNNIHVMTMTQIALVIFVVLLLSNSPYPVVNLLFTTLSVIAFWITSMHKQQLKQRL